MNSFSRTAVWEKYVKEKKKNEHEEEMEVCVCVCVCVLGGMEKLHRGIIRLMEWLFGYSAEVGKEIMILQLA